MAQHGINFLMPILLDGAVLEDLEYIELIFKQQNSENAKIVKQSLWASDDSGDAKTKDGAKNVILVPWTREETYKFQRNGKFYGQARLHYSGTEYQPETPPFEMVMNESLFGPQEEVPYGSN
jgi:hypothetical protein